MIAKLQFDLSDPQERRLFNLCNRASDLADVVRELDNYLRADVKYGAGNLTTAQVRERLNSLLSNDLWSLVFDEC